MDCLNIFMTLCSRMHTANVGKLRIPALVLVSPFLLASLETSSAQVVRITGKYSIVNYAGGKPVETQSVDYAVTLGANSWGITATNRQEQEWESLSYDGTNTYLLMPLKRHFDFSLIDSNTFATPPRESVFFGTINAGPRYNMPVISYVELWFPWMVYCLSPHDVSPDMPLLWKTHTMTLGAYGFRWNIVPSSDGNRIQSIAVVKDKSLDMADKGEFLRPAYDYPRTREWFASQVRSLTSRRGIPNGFVEATYTCGEWYDTSGMVLPKAAEFIQFVYWGERSFPIEALTLKADEAVVINGAVQPPLLTGPTYVRDYRYASRTEDRIYPYAHYSVTSGAWRSSDDAELLAQREDYLHNGPKFGGFGFNTGVGFKGRRAFVWALLAFSQVLGITILVRTKLKNNTEG